MQMGTLFPGRFDLPSCLIHPGSFQMPSSKGLSTIIELFTGLPVSHCADFPAQLPPFAFPFDPGEWDPGQGPDGPVIVMVPEAIAQEVILFI